MDAYCRTLYSENNKKRSLLYDKAIWGELDLSPKSRCIFHLCNPAPKEKEIRNERETQMKDTVCRQIDRKPTMQVRIDTGLHQLLKVKAAKQHTSIKTLLEGCLAELLAVENSDEDHEDEFS